RNEADLRLYETVPLETAAMNGGVALGQDAVDNSLWVALLVRSTDRPADNTPAGPEKVRRQLRAEYAGKALTIRVVAPLQQRERRLLRSGLANRQAAGLLQYEMPRGGALSTNPAQRIPQYRALDASPLTDVLAEPGVVEVRLPATDQMRLWTNLDPLE